VIVAQGHEAGGGLVGAVGGMVIVPAVIDAVAAVTRGSAAPPVVAAGGVADGRGLAAALALGAEGVVIGTRMMATDEASVAPVWKTAICAARETDTVYTRVANLVARPTWAAVAPSRVLKTRAIEEWIGREAELTALVPDERAALAARWADARMQGRRDDTEVIAGQDCGLIHEVLSAAEVVRRMVAEAEEIVRRLAARRNG
jgi:nitronate monooxygenase